MKNKSVSLYRARARAKKLQETAVVGVVDNSFFFKKHRLKWRKWLVDNSVDNLWITCG